MIGNIHYMFGERHKDSEMFTTLLHNYVVKEHSGDVHHKGSDHHHLIFYSAHVCQNQLEISLPFLM